MAFESISEKLPEPLTRQIGPLPLWAWAGGLVGLVVVFRFMGSGSGDEPDEEPEQTEASFDFEEIEGASGPTFDDTSGGTTGTNYPKPDAKTPRCPAGYKSVRNAAGTRWICQRVPKPARRKGYTLKWSYQTESWQHVKTKSFTLEEPHLDFLSAPNGAAPTISTQQMAGIGIAAPDKTPRAIMEPMNDTKPGATDLFIAPRVPPAPMSRRPGRPFHGANVG